MGQFESAPSTIFKGDETASIKIGVWPEPVYVRASDGGMFTLALAIANGWQALSPADATAKINLDDLTADQITSLASRLSQNDSFKELFGGDDLDNLQVVTDTLIF